MADFQHRHKKKNFNNCLRIDKYMLQNIEIYTSRTIRTTYRILHECAQKCAYSPK